MRGNTTFTSMRGRGRRDACYPHPSILLFLGSPWARTTGSPSHSNGSAQVVTPLSTVNTLGQGPNHYLTLVRQLGMLRGQLSHGCWRFSRRIYSTIS